MKIWTDGRLRGYLSSEVVFNASHKVLSDTEINELSKRCLPLPSFINEADLRWNSAYFSRKMWCKWLFRNEINGSISETPEFRVKST